MALELPASIHEFYTSHSVMTDPGEHADLYADLPHDWRALCGVVQGLLLHPFETELYAVDLTSAQKKEVNIRTTAEMLRRIRQMDDRPLTEPRLPGERLIGNCRDHAVLYCSILRHLGIPARVRVGFSGYLVANWYADHWVSEVWDAREGRWHLVDSQIDADQRLKHKIDFDTLDMTPAHFLIAGRAWKLCREGKAKSTLFGHNRKAHGIGFIRASLVQDLGALNKVEVLPWDIWWELARKDDDRLTPEEKNLVDRLAEMTIRVDDNYVELRSIYEDEFEQATESKLVLLGIGSRPSVISKVRSKAGPRRVSKGEKDEYGWGRGARLAAPVDTANIVIRGAQQHNLKHIDVTIPRYKLVVLTGVSGSGKSSLAFDTLYAEGQRRYVDSLSSYVRRYMEQMDKPKVDYIGGLSPAIAIEQKSVSKNPRSTVATVTEVMDYLRVLFSRVGKQHCPQCGRPVEQLSPQSIADRLLLLPPGTRFQLLAPLAHSRKTGVASLLEQARKEGFARARVDGSLIDLITKDLPSFIKTEKHKVELVVDRLAIPLPGESEEEESFNGRLIDSVETALKTGKGTLIVALSEGEQEIYFSEQNACPYCEISLQSLTASLFSFNAPSGMCPDCNGLGTRLEVDPNLIVEHPELSLLDGASRWYGNLRKKKNNKYWLGNLETIAERYGGDLVTPWKDLPQKFRDVVLYGSGDEKLHFTYESSSDEHEWHGESTQVVKGVVYHISRLFRQTKSDYTRRWYASFMSQQPCPTCGGTRLCAEARNVTVGGLTFPDVLKMTIEEAYNWVVSLWGEAESEPGEEILTGEQLEIAAEILKELQNRLLFMLNVGLHYLTLDRPAPTLSGGEGQRIRLASQLGCGLVGVLYILDEPSIGLHARDQRALLDTLLQLRDMGNTVLVVEHDAETMRAADWLIDLGPGAGLLGGEVVSAGTPAQVAADPGSLTGRYLSGALQVTAPNGKQRRSPKGWLALTGARLFNLKSIDARFPLGNITCITGVSGSGKSSLIAETLFPALERLLHNAQTTPGPYDRLDGLDQLDKVINITQDPIGRTPRSNPVTYAGVFGEIRQVFASTPEARRRGYGPDRFSFNVKGGRCEACQGHGQKRVEMHFLPDVWVTCQECKGARYNRHTLEVEYKGKNIAQVLEMDVQEALDFFGSYPGIRRILQTLHDVGLDYVKLGQSATTLSGGEAQRVKLAKELSRVSTGRTIYILDEPTTGLHFADIQRLLDVLHRLVDAGNTVLVIEHNLDVIRTADWIIDLGPEGGEGGGYIIAEGSPENVAQIEGSYTGQFLRNILH